MKKTFRLSALLLVLTMIFTLTACEKEPENTENWSLPGVAEEIKFNGEKVFLPMSLDDFGEGYTVDESIIDMSEFGMEEGYTSKFARTFYNGEFFVDLTVDAYNGNEIESSRPICLYKFMDYTTSDNPYGDLPYQTVPPNISVNGVGYSSTVEDIKKAMGEPTNIRRWDDGTEHIVFYEVKNSDGDIVRSIDFFFNEDGKMKMITIFFNSYILYASDFN